MRFLAALLIIMAAPATAQVVFAGGNWAAIDRGAACEASTRALRIAEKGKVQARAGFAFDVFGPRHGQFFAQLSRIPRAAAGRGAATGPRTRRSSPPLGPPTPCASNRATAPVRASPTATSWTARPRPLTPPPRAALAKCSAAN